MSDKDAQKYYDAALRVPANTYTNKFGAMGVDLVVNADVGAPKNDSAARAVLAGFDGDVRNVMQGLMAGDNRSIQATNQITDNGMGGSAGKTDDKKKDEWDRLLLLQQQLLARLAEIDRELVEVRGKITELETKNNSLDLEQKNIGEVRSKIEDHLSGKSKLEVGADGKLKDKQVETALEDYERRTGKKVDRNNQDALNAALRDLDAELQIRLNQIEEERKRNNDEIDRYRKREKVLEDDKVKIDESLSKVESAQSKLKVAEATGDVVEIKKAKEEAAVVMNQSSKVLDQTLDMDDLNGPATVAAETKSAIDLKTSVASTLDPQVGDVRLSGGFNSKAQIQEAPQVALNDASLQDKQALNTPRTA